jgi:DNA-binding Lrp family transcriptional regulator
MPVALDAIDQRILQALQEQGRLANVALAPAVGLRPSACLRRVKRLEAAGVITGYHAAVDPVAADRGFEIIVHADLAVKNRRTVETFEAQVAAFPEVTELRRMFGAPDYLIWIAVKDREAYAHFLLHKLMEAPALARLESRFTMKVLKAPTRASR